MKELLALVVIVGALGYWGVTVPQGSTYKIRVNDTQGFHVVEKKAK